MSAGKLVVVGQAPGRRGDPFRPLEGGGVLRLLRWAGVDLKIYMERTERVNLFKTYPGKAGKGDRFNRKLAQAKARALFPRLSGRRCVLLGANVARALGVAVRPGWPFSLHAVVLWNPRGSQEWDPEEGRDHPVTAWRCSKGKGDGYVFTKIPPAFVTLIPHPSGVSHFYNLDANRRRAGEVFRACLGLPRAP